MAANFNLPTVDTTYTAFPTQIIENIDAALQQLSVGSPSNVPTNAIKWDSSANRWKKYNGSAYVDLTGTYDLNAQVSVTQLNLGDDEAVRLGNGNDFQLFHRASDNVSIIAETGSSYLSIQSNGNRIELYDSANNRNMAEFFTGGACTFKHGATTRLQTTSGGATVTGDLTTTGSALIGSQINLDGSNGGTRRIKIGQGRTANDYSFIDLIGDATYTTYGLRLLRNNTGPNATSALQHRGTGTFSMAAVDAAPISLATSNNSRLYIESGGDVGIGLTNPSNKLHIYSGSANALSVQSTVSGANILLVDNDTESKFRTVDGRLQIEADTGNAVASSEIRFLIDGDTKYTMANNGVLRADKTGTNIGFKAPDNAMFIAGTNNDLQIFHNSSNSIINDNGTGELLLQRGGSTVLALSSTGINATGTQHKFSSGTSGDCELVLEADTDNNNENDNPRILFRQDGGNDWNAIGTDNNVLAISNSVSSGGGIIFKLGSTNGYTNAVQKWKIESDGDVVQTGNLYIENTFPIIQLKDTNNDSDYQIRNDNGSLHIRDITNGLTRFSVTSGGSVTVSNSNPALANNDADDLIVGTTSGARGITIVSSTTDTGNLFFSDGTASNQYHQGAIVYSHGDNDMKFMTNGFNERLKISSVGDIHISTGRIVIANGSHEFPAYSFTNSNTTGFYRFSTNQIGVSCNGVAKYKFTPNQFGPLQDDQLDLGSSNLRFDNIYATNNVIQTSDKNLKNTIATSDLGLDFINKLNPVSYKYNGKTRTHYGLIAQEIEAVLGAISKPATDFGGFCKDEVDEDGNAITPIYGLRYSEFISPIIKAIQELSAKVAALESA